MERLAIWKGRKQAEDSRVVARHPELADLNATVGEYATLIKDVSTDRAELLLTISKLQIALADASVSKALFADLEAELVELRGKAEQAEAALRDHRALERELAQTRTTLQEVREELAVARREKGTLQGQLTRLQGKDDTATGDRR